MRSEALFLALPVAATLLNVLFAAFFCLPHHTEAQPADLHNNNNNHHHQEAAGEAAAEGASASAAGGIIDRCVGAAGEECPSSLLQDLETSDGDEEDEEDPMLRKMPGYDFKAYVRADVSTFHGEEPGSRVERKPKYNGQACKFVNMSPNTVANYWVGGGTNVFLANVGPWSAGGIACYPTNRFTFTAPDHPDDIVCRFVIRPGTSVYYCDPYTPNDKRIKGCGKYEPEMRSMEELSESDRTYYEAHLFNFAFGAAYKNFTGGSEWLTMYPRNPPRHRIWRADRIGQEHAVTTSETHFVKIPDEMPLDLRPAAMGRDCDPMSDYREAGELNLTIKALSCSPRIFEIRNFLSHTEVDHILDVVKRKNNLERSTAGGQKSDTRTSRTTWIPRQTDPVVNAVYRRAAAALRLDEALLRQRLEGELDDERELLLKRRPLHEHLQIVHYDEGQEYTPHHDFGYPKAGQTDSPSRSINICMYLNDVPSGGETSFPRWRNGETSEALNVKPEKGKAVIFYMTTPDGNLDDLTQHAGLPVKEGEKWFANLWIYDPMRV